MKKKIISLILTVSMVAGLTAFSTVGVSAKSNAGNQTVGTVLTYVKNSSGQEVLMSHIKVEQMVEDLKANKIDTTVHNYSLLDKYVTTVHQEAQGFTVADFISYSQSKSESSEFKNANLTFAGKDKIGFWEIDQTGYDDKDTYTYNDLYGVKRYNFPKLFEYWNYKTQDYYDPYGTFNDKNSVIDYIFNTGEEEQVILSVEAYSDRYMATSKYEDGDTNMENYFASNNLLDSQRTLRLMKPMTKDELYNKTATVSDSRYWVARLILDMQDDPAIAAKGKVEAPKATMTEDDNYYYIRFTCATEGATILYNHNVLSPSYSPSAEYTGSAVKVSKEDFADGVVTMTCQAVKDGWTDAGVVTYKLKSSGKEEANADDTQNTDKKINIPAPLSPNPFTDIPSGQWYEKNVLVAAAMGLVNGTTATTFSPYNSLTYSQAVKLAACMHQYYTDGKVTLKNSEYGMWYNSYYEYCLQNGILSMTGDAPKYDTYYEMAANNISRRAYVYLFAYSLPDEAFTAINTVADNSIPDVKSSTNAKDDSSCIYKFYRAGICNGSDAYGTFNPSNDIKRSEVATIVVRMMDKTQRVRMAA